MDLDNKLGLFLGLAIGDALGAPLEFQEANEPNEYLKKYTTGGPHKVSIGEWTDDTSMAFAMATSLIEKKYFDADDIMNNFCLWYQRGEFCTKDKCFDIGNTVYDALSSYSDSIKYNQFHQPYRGRTEVNTSGNGALMRIAPVIIVAKNRDEAVRLAIQQTLLTHGSELCVKYSVMFAEELYYGKELTSYSKYKLPKTIDRKDVMSGGFVKETYEAAWWAFSNSNSFEECIIKAVNRGHDADTTGAVAGMLAGRHYGLSRIPDHFKDDLMMYDDLYDTALKLSELDFQSF